MSNPGVINLFSKYKWTGVIKRFQVEDNIGESIHIHINNFRIDLTIKEFYKLVDSMKESCKKLNKPLELLKNYDIDPLFFTLLAPYLKDLKSLSIKKIKLKKLKFLVRKKYSSLPEILIPRSIENTLIYKSLKGDKRIKNYKQLNCPGISNNDRINNLILNFSLDSYRKSNSYITCFNRQLYVRDGQHRCAILAEKYGIDTEVEILFLDFENKYNFNIFLFYIKFIIKILIKFLKLIKNKFDK